MNFITEEYYNEALEEAKQRDQERENATQQNQTQKLGKLHGIPVSIKDHVNN